MTKATKRSSRTRMQSRSLKRFSYKPESMEGREKLKMVNGKWFRISDGSALK